jgi:poly-D-alanine transfer protein DltD
MHLFIKKILKFFFLSTLIYIILVIMMGFFVPQSLLPNVKYHKGGYGHMLTRLNEADSVSETDVLVVGSSHAYRGLDPRIFQSNNIKLFNLGSSAQTPLQSELLLNNYLDKIKTDVVLFVVSPMLFENKGVESSLDVIANSDLSMELATLVFKMKEWSVFNTFLYSFGAQLKQPRLILKEEIVKGDDTYISGGFVEKKLKHIETQQVFKNRKSFFLESQKESFEKSLTKIHSKKIKVILIQPPVVKELYESIENNEEIDFYFSNFPGVEYYNMNKLLNLESKSHFYDSHHLNQEGVKLFNEFLIGKVFLAKASEGENL